MTAQAFTQSSAHARHFGVAAVLAAVALICAAVFFFTLRGQSSTTVNDLKRLRTGNPVELGGIVTYADPVKHGFYFQDHTAGMYVQLPAAAALPRTADRIELEAVIHNEYDAEAGTQAVSLEQVSVKVRGTSALPRPQPLSLASQFSSAGLREAQRVTTSGVVRSAVIRDRNLVLEIADRGQRMPVSIQNAGGVQPDSLIDAHVTVRGVLQLDYKDLAGPALRVDNIGPHLWVASREDMDVTSAPPAQIELAPSVRALITEPQWLQRGWRVRVQGTVVRVESDHVVLIENGGVIMPVETTQVADLAAGQAVEAVGWPTPRRFTMTLQRATVEPIDSSRLVPAVVSQTTPPMTDIQAIRALSPSEAARSIPVSLRGVLTMVQRSSDLVFIQSGDEAIFVDASDQALKGLEPGQQVRIDGLTGSGGFAPIIKHPRIEVLGQGTLPKPQKVDAEEAPTGTYDSEWVEIEGLVRPFAATTGNWYRFNLLTPVGVVSALLINPGDVERLEELVDAKVRVRGVFATVFTVDGVLTGYRMFVYSPDSIEVLNRSAVKADDIQTRAIRDLLRFSGKSNAGRRARIAGVVTLRGPRKLYVQDATGSVLIQTSDTGVQPGDSVEAVGYPAPSDHGVVLSDAFVRPVGKLPQPAARQVTAEQILSGDLDNQLVQVQARVLSHVDGATQQTLVLQDDYTNFNAQLDGGIPLPELREGTVVQITGLPAVQRQVLSYRDYNAVPASFRILLRSADDVKILKAAPWWNMRHAWPVLAVLSLSIFLAMLWVVVLRRRVQHQTAEIDGQRTFLRQVIDMCPNFIFVKDRDGRFALANRALAEAHGVQPEQMIGKSDVEVGISEKDASAYRRDDAEVMDSGREKAVFESHTDLNGRQLWLHTVKRPLLDERGVATQILGVANDVTLHKQAEETLKKAREVAESANSAKSEFLANMSHEIRTPLNGILGMSSLCLDTDLTREQREYVETVKLSADGLLIVINDILDFSKIEAGKLELDAADFDVRETLDAALKTLALRAHQKDLELVADVAPDVPVLVRGDASRLRQVLLNLIGNAIKFTERGEVVVRVQKESKFGNDSTLHFTVTDTGIGIAADRQQQIFNPFVQADSSTTREFGGTGLGLTISNRLVTMMGGAIWVQSEPGHGSQFHFTVRLQPVESPTESIPEALRQARVLVVDDNRAAATALESVLQSWQMKVQTAASATEALEMLDAAERRGEPIRLLLADLRMPQVDGLELIGRIRERPDLALRIVALLTSVSQGEDEARCRDLGVTEYVVKPVRVAELREALVRALSAEAAVQERPSVSRAAPAAKPVERAAEGHSGLKILLAEDNAVNQLLMIRLLQKRGHRVTVANNGRLALEAVEREHFDLILMDVQMPELDGVQATEEIRRREQSTGTRVPIVALTAHAMTGDREVCIAAGMDSYLTKPINIKELDATLELHTVRPANVATG